MRVWREGNRIRNEKGTGYIDWIGDDQIEKHVADALERQQREADVVTFGLAVLALRAQERRAPSQEREGSG